MIFPVPSLESNDFSDDSVWAITGSPNHGSYLDVIPNVSMEGDGVDNKGTLIAGAAIESTDGNKHTIFIGLNSVTPNVDATILYGQLTNGNSQTDKNIQISMQSNGVIIALFQNGLPSGSGGLGVASTGDTDFSDGVDRFLAVTVDGDADDVNIYMAKSTDLNLAEISYASQDTLTGAGYGGVGAGTPDTTIGGADGAGNQLMSSTTSISILKVWKDDFLTLPELQQVFDEVKGVSRRDRILSGLL